MLNRTTYNLIILSILTFCGKVCAQSVQPQWSEHVYMNYIESNDTWDSIFWEITDNVSGVGDMSIVEMRQDTANNWNWNTNARTTYYRSDSRIDSFCVGYFDPELMEWTHLSHKRVNTHNEQGQFIHYQDYDLVDIPAFIGTDWGTIEYDQHGRDTMNYHFEYSYNPANFDEEYERWIRTSYGVTGEIDSRITITDFLFGSADTQLVVYHYSDVLDSTIVFSNSSLTSRSIFEYDSLDRVIKKWVYSGENDTILTTTKYFDSASPISQVDSVFNFQFLDCVNYTRHKKLAEIREYADFSGESVLLKEMRLWCYADDSATYYHRVAEYTYDEHGRRTELIEKSQSLDGSNVDYKRRQVFIYGSPIFSVDKSTYESVAIWPNPTQGSLFISSKKPTKQINLVNLNGILVKRFDVDANVNQHSLNLSGLDDGFYFVELVHENQTTASGKFLKISK